MNKRNLLIATNIILLLAFITLVSTVILMQLFKSHIVFEIHEKAGFILVIAAILHIYLNWSWIKMTFFKKS